MKIIKLCEVYRLSILLDCRAHSFSFLQFNHSTVAAVHIFYYIFSTRLLAMTERRALRYRNIHIDTEKAINELLNLYSNDGLDTFRNLIMIESVIEFQTLFRKQKPFHFCF